MPDLPTRADLYQIGRQFVVQRSKKIDPSQVDVLGSDVNVIVGSQSVVLYSVVKQLGYRTNALLLDGADGEDLDRYAYDRYKLPRKGASASLGSGRLFRPTAAAGAGSVPVGTIVRTLTGIEYMLTTPAIFGVSDTDNIVAFIRAQQAGKASQVGKNQVRQFANVQALFDPTIQINNDAATAGGENVEDDDDFRNRIRDFWLTARRGVLSAIEFGAKSVPGVVSAQAVEALNPFGQPARVVNLYIADSSGVASDALAQQVLIALDDFRAAGIAVLISNSLPQLVGVRLALAFVSGVDTISLKTQVQAAVVEFINSLPVNGTLYRIQLGSVLQRFATDGLIVGDGTILAPAGDVVPGLGQTLRTTIDRVVIA